MSVRERGAGARVCGAGACGSRPGWGPRAAARWAHRAGGPPQSRGAGAGEAPAGAALGAQPCRTCSGDPLELEEELTVSVSQTCAGASACGELGRGAGKAPGGGRVSLRRLSVKEGKGSPQLSSSGENRWVTVETAAGVLGVPRPFVIFLSVGSPLPSASAF